MDNAADARLVSPCREAWQWIEHNPGTDSATALAKLLLSLWNGSNAFSFREYVNVLDEARTELALRVAIHFANYGEDRELIELGYKVCEVYPRLWALGQTAWEAKRVLREQWRGADAHDEEKT